MTRGKVLNAQENGDDQQNGAKDRKEASVLLQAINITKKFGDVLANDAVNLQICAGEIHALLGENGAGKSTLVKILYGALDPNDGELLWEGRPMEISSPADARELGIGMVFQHFSVFESLSVTENIALALPDKRDMKLLAQEIHSVSHDYGLPLDPEAIVADLPVGIRQRIEIVRCLLQAPRLIIMDEPTSVLTPQEADQLFLTLKRLTDEGCAILYISHRLEEVQRICHHATIMRHGKVELECDPSRETSATLARMMVGAELHSVNRSQLSGAFGRSGSNVRLKLNRLTATADGPFSTALEEVSLDVRAGEVVAIAGIAGNGQSELFELVSGERLAQSRTMIEIDGEAVGRWSVERRRTCGAAFAPEERLGHGAVPGFKLSENLVLTRHAKDDGIVGKGLISSKAAQTTLDRIIQAFDVRMTHADPEARALSGGNLQKFVIGRELDRAPNLLVVNQPTWGVDAGAAAKIRQELINLAMGGGAVLIISQDLDEIYEIADRIAVISNGRLSQAYPASSLNREKVGLLMGGMSINDDGPLDPPPTHVKKREGAPNAA